MVETSEERADSGGRELVSHPATSNWRKTHRHWNLFLFDLDLHGENTAMQHPQTMPLYQSHTSLFIPPGTCHC